MSASLGLSEVERCESAGSFQRGIFREEEGFSAPTSTILGEEEGFSAPTSTILGEEEGFSALTSTILGDPKSASETLGASVPSTLSVPPDSDCLKSCLTTDSLGSLTPLVFGLDRLNVSHGESISGEGTARFLNLRKRFRAYSIVEAYAVVHGVGEVASCVTIIQPMK